MSPRPFIVIVRDRFENEHSRIAVEAATHREAATQVRLSREWWQWPEKVTFTPRLADVGSYKPDFVDSQCGNQFDRVPA